MAQRALRRKEGGQGKDRQRITVNFQLNGKLCHRNNSDFFINCEPNDLNLTWKALLVKYRNDKVNQFVFPPTQRAFCVKDKRNNGKGKCSWHMDCTVADFTKSFQYRKSSFKVVVYYPEAGEEFEEPVPPTAEAKRPTERGEKGATWSNIIQNFHRYVDNDTAHRMRKEVKTIVDKPDNWNHLVKYLPKLASYFKDVFLDTGLKNLNNPSFDIKKKYYDDDDCESVAHTINSQDSRSDLQKGRIPFQKDIRSVLCDIAQNELDEKRAVELKAEFDLNSRNSNRTNKDSKQKNKILAFIKYMPYTISTSLLIFGSGGFVNSLESEKKKMTKTLEAKDELIEKLQKELKAARREPVAGPSSKEEKNLHPFNFDGKYQLNPGSGLMELHFLERSETLPKKKFVFTVSPRYDRMDLKIVPGVRTDFTAAFPKYYKVEGGDADNDDEVVVVSEETANRQPLRLNRESGYGMMPPVKVCLTKRARIRNEDDSDDTDFDDDDDDTGEIRLGSRMYQNLKNQKKPRR